MMIVNNVPKNYSQFDSLIATFSTKSIYRLLGKKGSKEGNNYFKDTKYVELNQLNKLRNQIKRFTHLEADWDSYNADVISKSAIDKATEALGDLYTNGFLSGGIFVHVFPMRDGGIQFEFDGENICAELEISPDKKLLFILFNEKGKILFEKNILELSELSTLLEEAPQYD